MRGLTPWRRSSQAANNPAGPLPTIRTVAASPLCIGNTPFMRSRAAFTGIFSPQQLAVFQCLGRRNGGTSLPPHALTFACPHERAPGGGLSTNLTLGCHFFATVLDCARGAAGEPHGDRNMKT